MATSQTKEQTLQALDAWHDRLEQHFRVLMEQKASSGVPIFALEHGLRGNEVEKLQHDVRESLKYRDPTESRRLPWIVYAAEFGYAYSGEEYWPSFERETPLWRPALRHWMRDSFRQFSLTYKGAEPQGAWAAFFRIIAWPITHGVLPRDLQKQLAKLLFDARLSLRPDLINTAPALGKHLQLLSRGRSARFQQFAENTNVLGQIAAALLLQDRTEEATWILPSTLSRIVEDIGRERSAGEWLEEARLSARLRFKGLQRLAARDAPVGATPRRGAPALGGESTESALASTLEPSFFLRQVESDVWQVLVRLPGLRELAGQRPHLRQFLAASQAVIGGPAGRRVGRSFFLADAAPSTKLSAWPSPAEQLVHFESPPPDLELVLQSVMRGRSGESWLFRVEKTGEAREIRSRVVTPGESYVLLAKHFTERPAPGLRRIQVACDGVVGLRFDLPRKVEEPWVTILDVLDLSLVSTIRIWPAGLSIPYWSGDGSGVWISGEEIVLGVEPDYPLPQVDVTLGSAGIVPVAQRIAIAQTTFLSLGKLAPGEFRLELAAARATPGAGSGELVRGELALSIRSPRDFRTAASDNGILRLAIHPQQPHLEDIWEGRCEVLLTAPRESVSCKFSLFSRGSPRPIFEKVIPNLSLPLDTTTWTTVFSAQIRRAAESTYDDASACRVEFAADELGTVQLLAEREFVPVRWAASADGFTARLINLTGSEPTLSLYPCDQPDRSRDPQSATAFESYEVPLSGALLIAKVEAAEAGLVVVPRRALQSFSQLGSRPAVSSCARDALHLERLVRLAANWASARLSGSGLANAYRSKAVDAVVAEVFSSIGGDTWRRVETRIIANTATFAHNLAQAKLAVPNRRDQNGIAAAIDQQKTDLAEVSAESRVVALTRILRSFGVDCRSAGQIVPRLRIELAAGASRRRSAADDSPLKRVVEFAVRIASAPSAALSFATLDTRDLVQALIDHPIIARAARYMTFCVNSVSAGDMRWLW